MQIEALQTVVDKIKNNQQLQINQPQDPNFIIQPLIQKKLLPDKPPGEKELTLVLDLDETLIHYKSEKNEFYVRPHLDYFLGKVKDCYELVVFTASIKEYADQIIDKIDSQRVIKHRLYRQHTKFQNNIYYKDLSLINRDLKKTIIVDNSIENFSLQPQNGIYIKSWFDDPNDLALRQMGNILEIIARGFLMDVRPFLQALSVGYNLKVELK